jgi:acetyl esterase/lipase
MRTITSQAPTSATRLVGYLCVALAAGCGASTSSGPGAGATSTTGGSSGVASSTGGSPAGASHTGGASGSVPGLGGATASSGASGGTTGDQSPGPGGSGGSGAGSGGPTGDDGTGGAPVTAATGGGSGTSAGGKSGAAAGGGGSGTPGGTAGATATSVGDLTPPVRDTASKVPISNAPGYTVEGNYPYGPLTAQRLDVIYPPTAGPKGTAILPAVVMFHGGGWVHSYTNNYGSGKDHMSTFFDRFLAHGFMVCNAEYRVNDNTVDGAPAPAAAQDALLAAQWCWDHLDYFHGDKTRFVVTGASAGGQLALFVGMATPDAMLGPTSPTDFKIAGIVDGYGPADIEAELGGVAAGWFPADLPNRAAIAKAVNPMTYVRKDIPPLICVQGSLDHTAPIADSIKLINMLTAAGADATMHQVPGAGHGFDTPATAWPDAEKAMFDWLTAEGLSK